MWDGENQLLLGMATLGARPPGPRPYRQHKIRNYSKFDVGRWETIALGMTAQNTVTDPAA